MSPQAFNDYLKIDAVNWSTLKEMRRSPLHYKYRLSSPRKDTATLRAGRAAHTAVFEPDRFLLDYAMFDGAVRRGKAWDAFVDANPHRTIIKPDEYHRALAIRDAVRSHPLAVPYLARGKAEHPVTWTDDETGLRCKARVDFLSDSKPAIVDLKTSSTIDYSPFCSTAYRLAYFCQMGLYQWGMKVATGRELPVVVIAVEAGPPHDVGVFPYGADELEAGLNEARSLLTKLAYHREKDTWPGQYAEELELQFPTWATKREDENVADLGLED